MAAPRDKTYSTDRVAQWAERLTRVPHVWRIVLVLLVTLVLALLAWVVVDRIIVNEFGSMTPTFSPRRVIAASFLPSTMLPCTSRR